METILVMYRTNSSYRLAIRQL